MSPAVVARSACSAQPVAVVWQLPAASLPTHVAFLLLIALGCPVALSGALVPTRPLTRRAEAPGRGGAALHRAGGNPPRRRRPCPRPHAGFLRLGSNRGLLHDWAGQPLLREHGAPPRLQPRVLCGRLPPGSLRPEVPRPRLRPLPLRLDAAATRAVPAGARVPSGGGTWWPRRRSGAGWHRRQQLGMERPAALAADLLAPLLSCLNA